MKTESTSVESVKEYYGEVLDSTEDLKTSACCSLDAVPTRHQAILADIDDEILTKFYGCGSPIPPLIEGTRVLDLGSGTGRDAYLLSKLAGETGYVIGIDMTDEQLEVANRHVESQMSAFGFSKPNVDFRKGFIEDLKAANVEDNSIDVVISNCVINLSMDKPAVFAEMFRVLKPGGEIYFSDVYADRRISDELRDHPVLHGECLSGALYIEDFRRILADNGCPDYRVISSRKMTVDDPELAELCGDIGFYSITVRAFKLDTLEDRCEDYGQTVTYKGTIEDEADTFILDDGHVFPTGQPLSVCGNTDAMLRGSRYAAHFDFSGERGTHCGLFECAPTGCDQPEQGSSSSSCC
jgi:arsenite methyltransferase